MKQLILALLTFILIGCTEQQYPHPPQEQSNLTTSTNKDNIPANDTDTFTETNNGNEFNEELLFIDLKNPNFDTTKQISSLLEEPVSSNQLSGIISKHTERWNRTFIFHVNILREEILDNSSIISEESTFDSDLIETSSIIRNCEDGGTVTIKIIENTYLEMITHNCMIDGREHFIELVEYPSDKTIMNFEFINSKDLLVKGRYVQIFHEGYYGFSPHTYEIFVDIESRGSFFATGEGTDDINFSYFGAMDTYGYQHYRDTPNSIIPCQIEEIIVTTTIDEYKESLRSTDNTCRNEENFIELPWKSPGETIIYELTVDPKDDLGTRMTEIAFLVRDAKVKGGNELLLVIADSNNELERISFNPSRLQKFEYSHTALEYTYSNQNFNTEKYYLYLNNFQSNWNSEMSQSILVDYESDFNDRITFKKIGYIKNGEFITPISNQRYTSKNEENYSETFIVTEEGYYFIELDDIYDTNKIDEEYYLNDAFGFRNYKAQFFLYKDEKKIYPISNWITASTSPIEAISFNGRIFAYYFLELGTYDIKYNFESFPSADTTGKKEILDYSIIIDKIEFGTHSIIYD
ncbi:hypothetical protein [Marinicellulosiphila megalodicopiae]|uniref:hypothetical protein n=1 Tax=Marinicellulosiphila megalodicopiae TaxID=2724896 RepID=UPI003BAF1138